MTPALETASARHVVARRVLLVFASLLVGGCGSAPIVDAPSSNQNGRVNYLILHFTTENFADSLSLLTEASDRPVSSHYLIPEPHDPTYEERSLRVFRLVPESRRAWHAGRSYWNGEEALNNRSIGIELVNRSYCVGDTPLEELTEAPVCFFADFAAAQITLLIDLAQGILARHPDIDPTEVVGHSDISPERKVDPGPRFPWQHLYKAGIGAWYDDDTMLRYREQFDDALPTVSVVQRGLAHYGYKIEETGTLDAYSRKVVRAFQMHFLPSTVSGEVDRDTVAVLFALIEKYRPEQLEELLQAAAEEQQTPDSEKPLSEGL